MYKIIVEDTVYLFTGNVYPEFSDEQLESIGMVDVMVVPVGGNGYTLDASGALQLIKAVEPKVVIPTHYADPALKYPVEQQPLENVLKNLSMEVHNVSGKFRFKPAEASNTTQLIVLARG
jgi:L-ascorbate metabolism protein UlaG (beta-lactamase superfamily)